IWSFFLPTSSATISFITGHLAISLISPICPYLTYVTHSTHSSAFKVSPATLYCLSTFISIVPHRRHLVTHFRRLITVVIHFWYRSIRAASFFCKCLINSNFINHKENYQRAGRHIHRSCTTVGTKRDERKAGKTCIMKDKKT